MWTMAHIRRHIQKLRHDKPFSTREFLTYGTRKAVDQALWRLVNLGEIIRVARGLFIKKDAPQPSLFEIAQAKALAFGKRFLTHGSKAASKLGIATGADKAGSIRQQIYATDGCSSSFRAGGIVIRFIGTSARKLRKNDTPIGLIIRALWHVGKRELNPHIIAVATANLKRSERQLLQRSVYLMPHWMAKFLI